MLRIHEAMVLLKIGKQASEAIKCGRKMFSRPSVLRDQMMVVNVGNKGFISDLLIVMRTKGNTYLSAHILINALTKCA